MAPSDTSGENLQTVNSDAKASIQPHGVKRVNGDTAMTEEKPSGSKIAVSAADLPM